MTLLLVLLFGGLLVPALLFWGASSPRVAISMSALGVAVAIATALVLSGATRFAGNTEGAAMLSALDSDVARLWLYVVLGAAGLGAVVGAARRLGRAPRSRRT